MCDDDQHAACYCCCFLARYSFCDIWLLYCIYPFLHNTNIPRYHTLIDLDSGKGPVWITINPSRPMERIRDKMIPGRKAKEFTPLSEEIKAKAGTIKHTIEEDGEVSVCVRASPASSKNPMRFGLSVQTGKSNSEMAKRRDAEHLSGLEVHLERLTEEMEEILDEADFAKEREMVFHNQSRSMAQASMYWPMLHLSVLAITGVTMANHIVRFFKSRHII